VQIVGVPEVFQVGALSEGGMFLADEGVLWGVGDAENTNCQLGGEPYPGEAGVLGPVPIPNLPENIVAFSAGNAHAVALDAGGTAWVWGSRFGCTPWAVLDGVVDVAAGQGAFVLLLRDDGTVWGIGYNTFGQLGDGTTVSRFTAPTQAVGLTDVVDIAAGDRHSLFVKSDGTLWVSGWNRYCQLGLEDEVNPEEPAFGMYVKEATQVGLTDVVAVAGGYLHSVAVRADNTVWVWGSNSIGQLTTGTLTTLPNMVCTPVQIEFADGK
jgi:alpha-tubulin suppressor-like RCC1 family protein